MKELKVSLITENITDEQLDKLDKFISKVFHSPAIVITTGELSEPKEQTNDDLPVTVTRNSLRQFVLEILKEKGLLRKDNR